MMNERKEWYCIGVKDHSWWSNNAEWDINPFSGFWECKRHDEKGVGYENNAEDEDEVSYCPQSLTILQTFSTSDWIVKVTISDGKT